MQGGDAEKVFPSRRLADSMVSIELADAQAQMIYQKK